MNVLIVDDEQPMREMMSRGLALDGHTILQAPDAEGALAVLGQHAIAVALCDLSMPGRAGDWLVAQLRERFPDVAVILATADDAVPARISLRDGVVGYLVKPFRLEQMRNAVKDAIAWHQAATRSTQRQPREADHLDDFLRRVGRPESRAKP